MLLMELSTKKHLRAAGTNIKIAYANKPLLPLHASTDNRLPVSARVLLVGNLMITSVFSYISISPKDVLFSKGFLGRLRRDMPSSDSRKSVVVIQCKAR